MAESKDPAIKLFGTTIPLPETPAAVSDPLSGAGGDTGSSIADDDNPVEDGSLIDQEQRPSLTNNSLTEDRSEDGAMEETESDKGNQDENRLEKNQVDDSPQGSDKNTHEGESRETVDNAEELSAVDEKTPSELLKLEEEKSETNVSQEKTLKKPDKILPCPRCNSMDTKFCYYNNYNVNQPRHFCKNCQRYWTAGGTMRNVPVGAGRRKNKNSGSHYRHVNIPEGLQNPRPDIPNGVHPGTVLTFGSDTPLCESMASILNIAEKTMMNCPPNGFQNPEELKIPIDGLNSKDDALKEPTAQNPTFPPQMPCYPGATWPYPWNSAQWSMPVAGPTFCPNGFPMPFYPATAYWGWNIPWIPQPSPPSNSNPSSGPNSPTLGKHSRDGNTLKSTSFEEEPEENSSERSLWIPKTLRIDDPEEAAKSSIWTTLGILNKEKGDPMSRSSGLFRPFKSKCDERNPKEDNSSVLEANPAALSRSQNFHETS